MASHDQFHVAPGVAPDVVPIVAPTAAQVGTTPDVVLAATPLVVPHATRHVSCSRVHAAACGVP